MYLTHDIPVSGGLMRVGEWRPTPHSDAPVIVALHGMTSSHLAWRFLADALPECRIVAPDVRGRGRSAELPAPYGLARHTADLDEVLRALKLDDGQQLTLIGHSLGAFVALAATGSRPQAFARAILLDGGLPVTVPLNIDDADLAEVVLGVAAARRTELTFSSPAIYRKFWRLHPGFAACWSDELGEIADYDLVEEFGVGCSTHFRPGSSREAIETDARELFGSRTIRELLDTRAQAPSDSQTPLLVMTAPRGLLNESPGVYSERELAAWKAELPSVEFAEVPDLNHYSMVMSSAGAQVIAREYRRCLVTT